jgi:hypothetical protein
LAYIPALALLGQGLKKSPIGQKLDFANHPYLCKGLQYKTFCQIRLSNNKARKCLNHQTPKMVFESGIINQQKICT